MPTASLIHARQVIGINVQEDLDRMVKGTRSGSNSELRLRIRGREEVKVSGPQHCRALKAWESVIGADAAAESLGAPFQLQMQQMLATMSCSMTRRRLEKHCSGAGTGTWCLMGIAVDAAPNMKYWRNAAMMTAMKLRQGLPECEWS